MIIVTIIPLLFSLYCEIAPKMVSLPSRFKKEPRHASPDSSVRTLVTSEHATPSTTSVNAIFQTHFTDNEKDWEFLEDESPMDKKETCSSPVELKVHPLREPKGVLVSVQPPKNPPASLGTKKRHPVDIVLVLDVSSSMDNPVKMPKASDTQPSGGSDTRSKSEQESYHSRLDLAKNAMRGIVSGLDDGDRVGIVCFGYDFEVSGCRIASISMHQITYQCPVSCRNFKSSLR